MLICIVYNYTYIIGLLNFVEVLYMQKLQIPHVQYDHV